MIPKTIHYCWFGMKPLPILIKKCIASWNKQLPEYIILDWRETNFDVRSHPYSKRAYEHKKWAFVSDYARLEILYRHGGIYLDTDMYVLKSFDDFLDHDLALGKEDAVHISAGMIACTPKNAFIKKCLDYYDMNPDTLITIPRVLTIVYEAEKNNLQNNVVFEPIYFYPFTSENISKFNYRNAPPESYAVHLWNYSWGHPLVKLAKKLQIHTHLIALLDAIGVKQLLKKMLRSA